MPERKARKPRAATSSPPEEEYEEIEVRPKQGAAPAGSAPANTAPKPTSGAAPASGLDSISSSSAGEERDADGNYVYIPSFHDPINEADLDENGLTAQRPGGPAGPAKYLRQDRRTLASVIAEEPQPATSEPGWSRMRGPFRHSLNFEASTPGSASGGSPPNILQKSKGSDPVTQKGRLGHHSK